MEANELWEIPRVWEWTQIGSIGEVVAGGTPSTKEPTYWGNDINWISPADLTGYTKKTIGRGAKGLSKLGIENSSAKVMPAGSVHFSSRAPIGYVVISGNPLATNQGFKSLVPTSGIFNEYVYYYLKGAKQLAEERASGTTFLELSGKAFGLLPIPLPPFNEQRRIVAKIEELFSELDKGIESLKTAREQLKIYRQAVLKHAFEGKLTARWREESKDKLETADQLLARIKKERESRYQQQVEEWEEAVKVWKAKGKEGRKPTKPSSYKELSSISENELSVLPELPEEWCYVRLAEISRIGSGMSVSKARKLKDPIDVPYLRVANVQRGRLILDEIKKMPIEKQALRELALEKWDILFNEGGDRDKLGRGWIWEGQIDPCITQNHVFRATTYLGGEIHSKYVSHWGNTFGRDYFEKGGKQTTNLASINKTVLSMFPVPLLSPEEQRQIIETLDEIISVIDSFEREIEQGLAKSEKLRQSILKKAFSGQLVEQDPNDEPASVLLERIKEEKAAQEKNNKTKKTRKRKSAA